MGSHSMQLISVGQAAHYIEQHHLTPIMTPEGILVVAPSAYVDTKADELGIPRDDVWFDVQEVFPLLNEGRSVDLKAINNWLGY